MSTWQSHRQPDPIGTDAPDPTAPSADASAQTLAPGQDVATAPVRDDVRIEGAGDELSRLGQLPLAEHPAIFERIHTELQAALADVDSA